MIYETEADREKQAAAYERICKARVRSMMGPLPISYYIDAFLVDELGDVVAATEYKYRNISIDTFPNFRISALKLWSLSGWGQHYSAPAILFVQLNDNLIRYIDVTNKKFPLVWGGDPNKKKEALSVIEWSEFATLKE